MAANVMSKLTASPLCLTFEGGVYHFSPLSLQDMSGLKDFIRQYIMAEAKKTAAVMLEAGAPAEHISALWTEAAEACKRPLQSEFVMEPECLSQFISLSLSKKHPAVTRELVMRMLGDEDVLNQIMSMQKTLNSVEEEVKKE